MGKLTANTAGTIADRGADPRRSRAARHAPVATRKTISPKWLRRASPLAARPPLALGVASGAAGPVEAVKSEWD
jgi:hypothetical protein